MTAPYIDAGVSKTIADESKRRGGHDVAHRLVETADGRVELRLDLTGALDTARPGQADTPDSVTPRLLSAMLADLLAQLDPKRMDQLRVSYDTLPAYVNASETDVDRVDEIDIGAAEGALIGTGLELLFGRTHPGRIDWEM